VRLRQPILRRYAHWFPRKPDGDIDPTGASVDLRFADISRVHDGRIVSYHTYYDQLGMLTQLGLMGHD